MGTHQEPLFWTTPNVKLSTKDMLLEFGNIEGLGQKVARRRFGFQGLGLR